jgi:hypothetical protein
VQLEVLHTLAAVNFPISCCAGYLHDNRKAQKAAYRRAADLLQACGAARRRVEGAAAADGAYEGALGLTRKLHYTGYVQVCQHSDCNAALQLIWTKSKGSGSLLWPVVRF